MSQSMTPPFHQLIRRKCQQGLHPNQGQPGVTTEGMDWPVAGDQSPWKPH